VRVARGQNPDVSPRQGPVNESGLNPDIAWRLPPRNIRSVRTSSVGARFRRARLNDWIDFYREPDALPAFAQGFGAPAREDRANGSDSQLGMAATKSPGDVGETRPYRAAARGARNREEFPKMQNPDKFRDDLSSVRNSRGPEKCRPGLPNVSR